MLSDLCESMERPCTPHISGRSGGRWAVVPGRRGLAMLGGDTGFGGVSAYTRFAPLSSYWAQDLSKKKKKKMV